MADCYNGTVSVSRAYTYHVAWILGKSLDQDLRRQGQHLIIQSQDLYQVSSRILEAKARLQGQQDCYWTLLCALHTVA